MKKKINVNASNYEYAVATAVDDKGHGRVVRIDRIAKVMELAPKTYDVGDTHDSVGREIATINLVAEQVARVIMPNENGERVTKANKVLVVINDGYAGRFFEVKKYLNKDMSADDVVSIVSKDWMSEKHKEAMESLVMVLSAANDAEIAVNAIKASELFYTDVHEDEENYDGTELKAGDKVIIKGYDVQDMPFKVAAPLKAGEYEVKDIANFKEKEKGIVHLVVSRWANIEEEAVPVGYGNLIDAYRGAKANLPKEERLKLTIGA